MPPAGVGALITAPAFLAAIASAGAGHGNYVAACVLYPFSMVLASLEGAIGPLAIGAALLQLPIYGALIARTAASKGYQGILFLIAVHVVATLACFSGLSPQFS